MDSRLYRPGEGVISIPIKRIGIQPNFLVIDEQYGVHKSMQINFQTGVPELTDCVQAAYKLVIREILAPNETYQTEDFRESTLFPKEPISLPVDLLPMFVSYQRIKANIQTVNFVLSKFVFRGILEGFVIEVDEVALDSIISGLTM